jgi:K+-transporting ATPase ATPase C chain
MFRALASQLRPALLSLLFFTVLTGLLYPAVVTGLAQVLFPAQANGSLILREGKPVGSELIGQPFHDPRHFWGRPSATSPQPYNAAASSGSNQGPTNPDLEKAVAERIRALGKMGTATTSDGRSGSCPHFPSAPVPVDLVTASGSGLDPHISPAAASYQVPRVARLRGLKEEDLRKLVAEYTEDRQLGVLGEARVNVLRLNLALDSLEGTR